MKTNLLIISLVVVGVASRLIPHWPNFTPVLAAALFAGVYIKDKKWAILIPLLTMFLSDVALAFIKSYNFGFHQSMLFNYGPLVLITLMGSLIRKPKFANVLGASLAGSVLFFLVSNFGSFIADYDNIFPNNFSGLIMCYELALPFAASQWLPGPNSFALNGLYSDLAYNGILFGGFAMVQQYVPALRLKTA